LEKACWLGLTAATVKGLDNAIMGWYRPKSHWLENEGGLWGSWRDQEMWMQKKKIVEWTERWK